MVLKTSGSLGVVLNAAKEIALDRFILKDIKILDMSNLVEKVLHLPEMMEYENNSLNTIDEIKLQIKEQEICQQMF